ncbi:MAG: magnesium/cobalt transporter CorA [Opitutales bacterium]
MANPDSSSSSRATARARAAVDSAAGAARQTAKAVSKLGRALGGTLGEAITFPLRLPGMLKGVTAGGARPVEQQPGSAPGIEFVPEVDRPPDPGTIQYTIIDYCPERHETNSFEQLEDLLAHPRPAWATVRWINIDGLNPYVINQTREAFGFHTLAAEDTLKVPQRPKVEPFDDHLFIVAHMLMLKNDGLVNEQVSFYLYENLLLTFQETPGDVWDPVRERIRRENSRLREREAGYLLYALLDAVVDNAFPILEHFGDRLEAIEEVVIGNPPPEIQRAIYGIKRELALFRRVLWPMREVINELLRDERNRLTDFVKTYLRDVYDHAVQAMDMVETFREMASSLNDLYMSTVSNRMNAVMKVLTIMSSIFVPMTFVAGIYGMNFEHMPELGWKFSYPVFWLVVVSMATGLLLLFRRKRWI